MERDLQIGDLLFFYGTSNLSKFIKWLTKSKYSHVAVYVGDGQVIDVLAMGKVGYNPLSLYEGRYDVYRYKKPLSNAQRYAILHYLRAQIGVPYDFIDALTLALRYLFKIHSPWREVYRRYICSELARNAYRAAQIYMPKGIVSPEELAQWPQLIKVS